MFIVDQIKRCWESFLDLLGYERTLDATKRKYRRRRGPIPMRPKPQPQPANNKQIDYVLNDMTTPNLRKKMLPPVQIDRPKFTVMKYEGGGFGAEQIQHQAANCFVTINNTLQYIRKMSEKPLTRFVGARDLVVVPRAGKDLNAFYNRRSMQFFYIAHPKIGTIYTADSSDIVAHELGHAILDSYRPDTWGAAGLEVWSFHEAFADLTAMLNIMSHEEVLHYALNQNGGDMRKPSVITNLSEHIGQVIFKIQGPKSGRNPEYLRSTINDFKYVNPGTLPKQVPHNKLAAECHSFGRIFLGAFYDILVMIYEDTLAKGHPKFNALKHARDAVARRVLFTIQSAAVNVRFYESIAKTMLWVEKTKFNNTYHDQIREIFFERNLMKNEIKMLSAPECTSDDGIMRIQSKMNIKLGDHMLRAQSDNPLYNVELDIPHDQIYLYDNDKNIYDSVLVSDEDAMSAAQDAIIYLHDSGSVSEGDDTPFEIQDGKLCRTAFIE
jgi:hypothetical protein